MSPKRVELSQLDNYVPKLGECRDIRNAVLIIDRILVYITETIIDIPEYRSVLGTKKRSETLRYYNSLCDIIEEVWSPKVWKKRNDEDFVHTGSGITEFIRKFVAMNNKFVRALKIQSHRFTNQSMFCTKDNIKRIEALNRQLYACLSLPCREVQLNKVPLANTQEISHSFSNNSSAQSSDTNNDNNLLE